MPMKNPPHPGRIVRQECLEPLGLTVTKGAVALGVSRVALSELVNERRGISPEMAIRLSKAFGSTPEAWAGLQLAYELAQAMKHADNIRVERVPVPSGAE
jgi:addiction module HigA family antidote